MIEETYSFLCIWDQSLLMVKGGMEDIKGVTNNFR